MADDFKRLMEGIARDIKQATKEALSASKLRPHAETLANKVKLRVRRGFGVPYPGAPEAPLKPIKGSTAESRRYKQSKGKLSSDTNPSGSNLTDTGQLIDSLQGVVLAEGRIRITPTGSRKGGSQTNVEVGRHVTESGRAFTGPSQSEQQSLAEEIRKDIITLVNQSLTKRK